MGVIQGAVLVPVARAMRITVLLGVGSVPMAVMVQHHRIAIGAIAGLTDHGSITFAVLAGAGVVCGQDRSACREQRGCSDRS